jgi:hypothetical protein
MADYSGGNYDERLDRMAKEFFEKRFHECTDGEKKAIQIIKAARERLSRLDKFLWELR